ncbi:somatostatin receptor type 2-like [Clavelina lepadiformis]|uniref:somatostatin receptor type 2-like n=1 Tax=Clavelina lepadiformis TaxID=159417 RepID=UPI00404144DB
MQSTDIFDNHTASVAIVVEITTEVPSYNRTYLPPFDDVGLAISAGILLPMAVFGILANSITIYVITQSDKLKSVFNYLIMSLCVSDLISAILSPLFVYRRTWGFDHWTISTFLCKVFWGGDTGTSVATSLHILFFSCLRFISVTWPHHFKRINVIHVKVIILAMWAISIGCGFVPFAIWFDCRKMKRNILSIETGWPSCTISLAWFHQFKSYAVIGYAVFFYVPSCLILIFSLGVAASIVSRRLKRRKARNDATSEKTNIAESKRQKKENQAIVQLMLIVGSFAIGYLPHTAYHIFATTTKAVTREDEIYHWWFGMSEYMCLRLSECLNPIFYNLASSKMRRETIRHLKRINCGCSKPRKRRNSTPIVTVSNGAGARGIND